MSIKIRLIIMNFLQFAVWGAYLTSMGSYLVNVGLHEHIGMFYAMQGIVSLFMPAVLGIIADRWIPAQKAVKLQSLHRSPVHGRSRILRHDERCGRDFGTLFTLYSLSVAFYMPTLALSNSVAYTALDKAGLDTIRTFPPIRIFGTIGFICSMWVVDLLGLQNNYGQFFCLRHHRSSVWRICADPAGMPHQQGRQCQIIGRGTGLTRLYAIQAEENGCFLHFLHAARRFLCRLPTDLPIPTSAVSAVFPEYAGTFGVQHANILISLSQISETLCILLIPFFLKRFGIKQVMLIAMLAWVLRFGLFGMGNPGSGVWMFVLSMIVYGVAFDFFNISGSLFVDRETDRGIRSSAQGLFVIMTNGFRCYYRHTGCTGGSESLCRFQQQCPADSAMAIGMVRICNLRADRSSGVCHRIQVQTPSGRFKVTTADEQKKKIELQVLNISNSQAQAGAYAMVLGEINGMRQLPVIIGSAEAQSMMIEMRGIVPPRPLTHTLFASVLKVLGATLLRVLIYKVDNGVFLFLPLYENRRDHPAHRRTYQRCRGPRLAHGCPHFHIR